MSLSTLLPPDLTPGVGTDWDRLRTTVAEWRPDLIVLIARKMPRLDEVLELRFADIAPVVSDLAIPFAAHQIKGGRVAVVDDIVNVGSTIGQALKAVERFGASASRGFALHSRLGSGPELADMSIVGRRDLDPETYQALCQQIPASVSALIKPYDLDFPILRCRVLRPIRTGDDLQFACSQIFGDDVYNLPARYDGGGGHRITIDFPYAGGLEKIRLYLDEDTGDVNVVPMKISSPLAIGTIPATGWLRDAYERLTSALGQSHDEERVKVAMFLDSLRVGAAFLERTSQFLLPTTEPLSQGDAQLIFGPAAATLPNIEFEDLLASPPILVGRSTETSPAYAEIWTPEFAAEVQGASPSTDPVSYAATLYRVLASWAGSQDPSSYRLPWPYSKEQVAEVPYLRLRVGFTFADFHQILRELGRSSESDDGERPRSDWAWRRTASKLLDRLIDIGTVVPTIAKYDGVFYRVYRKGESDLAREHMVASVVLGMEYYNKPMSLIRISKIAVIASLSMNEVQGTKVGVLERGNVFLLDEDVVNRPAEIARFMVRLGRIRRASGG
jgi:hypothetical protein